MSKFNVGQSVKVLYVVNGKNRLGNDAGYGKIDHWIDTELNQFVNFAVNNQPFIIGKVIHITNTDLYIIEAGFTLDNDLEKKQKIAIKAITEEYLEEYKVITEGYKAITEQQHFTENA